MNRKTLKTFVILSLFAAVGTAAAYAQSANKLTANIPFDFVVGKTEMPAGEYIVGPVSDSQAALLVQNVGNHTSAIVLTRAAQSKTMVAKPKLIFNRYGDQYFLSSVWRGIDNSGRELGKSSRERELAKSASNNSSVSLAAQLR